MQYMIIYEVIYSIYIKLYMLCFEVTESTNVILYQRDMPQNYGLAECYREDLELCEEEACGLAWRSNPRRQW